MFRLRLKLLSVCWCYCFWIPSSSGTTTWTSSSSSSSSTTTVTSLPRGCGHPPLSSLVVLSSNVALAVCNERVIRILRGPNASAQLQRRTSLVVLEEVAGQGPPPYTDFVVTENDAGQVVTLRTPSLLVTVTYNNNDDDNDNDNNTIRLSFFDALGTLYTHETESVLSNRTVRQSWSLQQNGNESIYGGGQFANGLVNYRAAPMYWVQSNLEAVVPFLVSSEGYGILWDLYGETWFNPPSFSLHVSNRNETFLSGTFFTSVGGDYWFAIQTYDAWNNWNDLRLSLQPTGHHDAPTSVVCEHVGMAKVPQVLTCRARNLEHGVSYRVDLSFQAADNVNQPEPTVHFTPVESHHYTSIQTRDSNVMDYYFVGAAAPPPPPPLRSSTRPVTKLDSVMAAYRQLTGPAPLFPKKAYGFWQCKERYHNQSEVLASATQLRAHNIPVDVLVQDWRYWGSLGWGPQWDPASYPHPKEMIQSLHDDHHLSFLVSVWSRFDKETKFYKELLARGLLINGTTWFDAWNPMARIVFFKYLNEALFQNGADGVWLDATEPEGDPHLHKTMYLGSADEYRSSYSLEVSKSFYQGFTALYPHKRPIALSRSSFAGQQRFASMVWSGDTTGTFPSLFQHIGMALNYQLSGMPYWTCDIGGFFRPDNQYQSPEYRLLLIRWFQFGVFTPIMRVHGRRSDTELYHYGNATKSLIVDSALALRYRLLHYIYSGFRRVEQEGYTMGRAMVFDFPNDMAGRDLSDQFMFGESFLVAPLYDINSRRRFYLPSFPENTSVWRDFYTGNVVAPGWHDSGVVAESSMLLFVRSSILVLGPKVQHAHDISSKGRLEVRVYTGEDASFSLFEDDGIDPSHTRPFTTIIFEWSESASTLTIRPRQGNSFPGMWKSRTVHVVLVRPGYGVGVKESKFDASLVYDGRETVVPLTDMVGDTRTATVG